MNRLVILLAMTTMAFAGSTIYFARQLSLERERPVARTAAAPIEAEAAPVIAAAPAGAPPARAAEVARDTAPAFMSGAVVNAQPMSEEDMKKFQAEYSRNLLAQLSDPQRREEMLAEHKMMTRYSYPRVERVLGLSAEEHSRFLELIALQQLDLQEANAKCMVEPDCQLQEVLRDGGDTRKRELDALLGAERAQKFETYKNTMGEREAITQLRNRLPDAQRLSDEKAEALVAALAEERDLLHKDAARTGTAMHGFSLGAGMVFAPADSDASFEERYEIARQSSQRLRDRAAQYLNAEQLRAFNEMQDETLISLRGMLRNKDSGSIGAMGISTTVD
jgi:hypothetical protein